ncbi:MAG: hypothetical protein WC208_08440 [Gallionella sp.]|jgi:hypothetical protein
MSLMIRRNTPEGEAQIEAIKHFLDLLNKGFREEVKDKVVQNIQVKVAFPEEYGNIVMELSFNEVVQKQRIFPK